MPARFADARAVFFDIDNTLYDFRASVRATLAHLVETFPEALGRYALDDLEARYWAANDALAEDVKLELIARDPFVYRRATWAVFLAREESGLSPGDPAPPPLRAQFLVDAATRGDARGDAMDLASRLADAFGTWRFANLARSAYEGAPETVRATLASGRAAGIISNGPSPLQRAKFRALGYEGVIPERNVVISGEFGKPKPDPSIFLAAAERAGVAPEDALFIGDSVECDVASKAVGMRFVFFDAARGPRPDFKGACGFEPDAVAHDYAEIRRLVGV